MKLLLKAFLIILVIGCSENRTNFETLQGDWQGQESGEIKSYLHVSGDSLLFNDFFYQKYRVYDDSIVVDLDNPYQSRITSKQVTQHVFYITKLTDSNFRFETVLEQRQRRVNDFKFDTVEFRFERFKPIRNEPKLVRIEFSSGECYYGGCPQRNLIVDSSGYYYYEPVENVDIDTTFESNTAHELFSEISLIVSSIPIVYIKSLDGITIHAQVLHSKLIFDNGDEVSIFTDHTNDLFPVFLKLEHSLDFVDDLSPTKKINFSIRDTLDNYPL
ncbi:hypothetical protein [Gracilimonas sp. BCB1]|uniref:hypothetical protein n=1 Tax=Gracilimonas sp. BCB1 TaxID=3152362 RepID=UPI0032D94322